MQLRTEVKFCCYSNCAASKGEGSKVAKLLAMEEGRRASPGDGDGEAEETRNGEEDKVPTSVLLPTTHGLQTPEEEPK